MSINSRIADDQPESFAFSAESKKTIKTILAKYPSDRKASAVIPLLDLAQRQHDNWIPMKAIECIAETLDMAEIRVLEVATFYTMFNLRPVGKYFIQACGTTLVGSAAVMTSSAVSMTKSASKTVKPQLTVNSPCLKLNALGLA